MATTHNPTGKQVVLECPNCHEPFKTNVGSIIGRLTSKAKEKAAMANGLKGGRPKGSKNKKPKQTK